MGLRRIPFVSVTVVEGFVSFLLFAVIMMVNDDDDDRVES